jgi:tetratricopeptide (TPR) repeat protein
VQAILRGSIDTAKQRQYAEKTLGPEHPDLATLYSNQGNYEEAEQFLKRALAICEQGLGPTHPNTQKAGENYASLLRDMNKQKG